MRYFKYGKLRPDVPCVYDAGEGVYIYVDEMMNKTVIPDSLASWVRAQVEGGNDHVR